MFDRIILPNGVTVIICPIPTVQSLFMRVDYKNGPMFEEKKDYGVSHFLEHYIHQGNEVYPKEKEFITELEKDGIYENATTNLFGTTFLIKTPISKAEKAVDMLYAMLTKPIFPKEQLQHVREVVLQEYYDYWQHPESIFWNTLFHKRFTDDVSYTKDALGTKESIESITKKDVDLWYEKFYTNPSNILVILAGNINSKIMQKKLLDTFGTLAPKPPITFPHIPSGNYSKFLVYHKEDIRDQISFSLSFPAFGWENRKRDDERQLYFLARLLASSRLSRLYHLLREKHNLVYGIHAGATIFSSRGLMSISGSTSNTNLLKAFELIKDELIKIKKEGFSEEEIKIAKNLYESGAIFEQETPEGIAGFLRSQEFWNLPIIPPEENVKKIQEITAEQIHNLANEVIDFSSLNIGVFGKLNPGDIKKIEKLFRA